MNSNGRKPQPSPSINKKRADVMECGSNDRNPIKVRIIMESRILNDSCTTGFNEISREADCGNGTTVLARSSRYRHRPTTGTNDDDREVRTKEIHGTNRPFSFGLTTLLSIFKQESIVLYPTRMLQHAIEKGGKKFRAKPNMTPAPKLLVLCQRGRHEHEIFSSIGHNSGPSRN